MGVFEHFPYTNFHDLNLNWIVELIRKLDGSVDSMELWKAEHEKDYKALAKKVDGLVHSLVDVIAPWDSSLEYQIYSMVEYQGTNYIAIQDVPVGVMITNTDYWTPANTIVEQINAIGQDVSTLKKDLLNDVKISFPADFPAVDSGDITLLQTENYNILVDTHLAAAWTDVNSFLVRHDVTHIEYLFITHFHIDHSGNVVNLINNGYVDDRTVAIIPPDCRQYTDSADISSHGSIVKQALEEAGCEIIIAYDNLSYTLDDLELDIYNANPAVFNDLGWSNDYNDVSYMMKVIYGDSRALLTADCGRMPFERAITNGFLTGTFKLYKIEHHGMNSYPTFIGSVLQKIHPDVAFLPLTSFMAGKNGGTIGTSTQFIAEYGTIYPQYANTVDTEFIVDKSTINCVQGFAIDNVANSVQGINVYVDINASGIMDGTQAHPFKQIRQAIAWCRPFAAARYIIHVADGTYDENATSNDHNAFGNFDGLNIQIVGNNSDPASVVIKMVRLYAYRSSVYLQYLTLEIGDAGYLGFYDCNTYMMNCVVNGTTETSMYISGGAALLGSVTLNGFTSNGISLLKGCRVTATGCVFNGSGHAISVTDGTTLQNGGAHTFGNTDGIYLSAYATIINQGFTVKEVKTTSVTFSVNLTVPAQSSASFANNHDLDEDIADIDTILAVVFEWSTGSLCYCPNIQFNNSHQMNGVLYNPRSTDWLVTQVRVRVVYLARK